MLRLRAPGVFLRVAGRRSSEVVRFLAQQLVAFLGNTRRRDGVEAVCAKHLAPVVEARGILRVRLILVGQFVEGAAFALPEMPTGLHIGFGFAPPTPRIGQAL